MKQIRMAALLLCLILLAACAPWYEPPPEDIALTGEPPAEALCSVEMLDVGQGLSVLIQAEGHWLLYDGGGRETSSYVVSRLRELGVDRLDYLVASHYDEDHISGLVGALATLEVETALVPDYTADTKIYRSFQTRLEENGAAVVHPAAGETYPLGGAEVQILGPARYDYPDENDRSIALRLQYGKFSCLLTGDAEQEAEADMVSSGLSLRSSIYVAGHHGSASSSSAPFVKLVSPRYGFLSCGADNAYGHPAAKTLETLRSCGAEIFRTDKQGPVTAYTDGELLWFSTEPTEDWSPGGTQAAEEPGYVLNLNSKKFHRPSCDSVRQISGENRADTQWSREALIAAGYSPCGSCKP